MVSTVGFWHFELRFGSLGVEGLPGGFIIVPSCGLGSGSHKVISQKGTDYDGAYG